MPHRSRSTPTVPVRPPAQGTPSVGRPAPDAPDVSVRAFRMLLLAFERARGRDALARVWREAVPQLPLDAMERHSNWVSLELLEDAVEALARASGQPPETFVREAARLTVTPEAIGVAYPLLRAVGTPRLCYRQAVALGPTYNRVGRFELAELTDTSAVLRYTSLRPERTRLLCVGRQGQFASFPRIWGLPDAHVEELACACDGAPACVYRLAWQRRPLPWHRAASVLLGAALGAALALLVPGATAVHAGLAAALGACAGGWLDAGLRLRAQGRDVRAQSEALTQSLRDLEARYRELFEAKARLEERVAERTASLARANTELGAMLERERLAALGLLAGGFAHEVRNPLNGLLNALVPLEALLAGALPPQDASGGGSPRADALELLGLVRGSAGRVAALAEGLLGFARTGGTAGSVDVPRALDAALALLAPRVGAGVRVVRDYRLDAPVPGDPAVLDPLWVNLVDNALRALQAAGGGTLTLAAERDGDWASVSVADSGPGIGPDVLPHLFEPFFTTRAPGEGVGLGLPLCRRAVLAHGGDLRVESEAGQGARFTVRLPLRPPARPGPGASA